MPTPKRRRVALKVKEVSLVPDGDNPPANVLLAKRRPEEPELVREREGAGAGLGWWHGLRKALGFEPSPDFEKRMFREVRAERNREAAASAIQARMGDLAKAMEEMLFLDDEEPTEKRLSAAVKEFAEDMEKEMADIVAGRMAKMFKRAQWPVPPAEGVVLAALNQVTKEALEGRESQTPDTGEKENEMAKRTLIVPADQVEFFQKALEDEDVEVVAQEAAAEEGAEGGEGEGSEGGEAAAEGASVEDLAKINSNLAKAVFESKQTIEALQKRLDQKDREDEERTVRKAIPANCGQPIDDVVRVALTLKGEDRDRYLKSVRVAAAAIEDAVTQKAFGSDYDGSDHGASYDAMVKARVSELRKAARENGENLTEEQAYAKAFNDPEVQQWIARAEAVSQAN